jgi:hypothetical protein
MQPRFRRRTAFVAASLLVAVAAGPRAGAETAPPPRTGFSGSWGLTGQTVSDPGAALGRPTSSPAGDGTSGSTAGTGRGRGGAATFSTAIDDPLEALGDARRIVVVDDGRRVEITYPSGRKRVVITDGEEREQDDGDGPAKVTAKRKSSPERVFVTSTWASGHSLKETWELSANPRRIVVTGKVDGRHNFSYRRAFEPVPDAPPTPTPAPVVVTVPTPAAPQAISSAPATASAPGVRPECSLRPPSGLSSSELKRLAKITLAEAGRRAVASAAPQRVTSVMSSDPELNEGCLVWPLDLRIEGKSGVLEVLIDSGDGKVLSSTFEGSH